MESPVFILRAGRTRAAAAFAGLLLAAAAGADVLVLRDGTRIETQGKWEQKGRQLIFTTPAGTLSTLRAAEVDLAASEQATAAAAAPKAPEAKAKVEKKPVMVLTDKDVSKAQPVGDVAAEPGAAATATPAAGAAAGKVEVAASRMEGGSGEAAFVVRGTVVNNSPVPVAEIGILAVATVSRDDVNRRVYCEAKIDSPLAPKGAADFSCPMKQQDVLATGLADAFDDAQLSFEVRSTAQVPAPPPEQKQPPQN